MAGMVTALVEFSDRENARTYTLATHTVQNPRVVVQKRSVAKTSEGVSESSILVSYGTVDSSGNPLASKVNMSAVIRYPVNGNAADVTAALAVFRDIVASDEFTSMVNSQNYVA